MATDSRKWQHFERLVAAIHKAADQGADVKWDDRINGRQFDVTVRFRKGLYQYLTVVECKDYAIPVPVGEVDAFVTKASDAQAHHAVMASTSGFQEGARTVGNRHNMTLLHVTDAAEIDASIFNVRFGDPVDARHIQAVELQYADGEKKELPQQSNAMTYYTNHVRIRSGAAEHTLRELIDSRAQDFAGGKIDDYQDHLIDCPTGARVIAPDDGEIPLKELRCVRVKAGMTKARTVTGPAMVDPYLLLSDVKVRNVATGEEQGFSQHGLALGINTAFEEGQFYEQPQLAAYYYCDRIDGNLAKIDMVESFQHGQLIQAGMTVETRFASHYIPVTDKAVTERLQRRLGQLKAKRAKRRQT